MSFLWPLALIGLALVPAVAGAYALADRRRRREAARFGSPALLAGIVDAVPRWRRHLPAALVLGALTLLVVGAARPQATVTVKKEEATIVLAIDTSRSMGADDVTPTRLGAARAAASAFLARVPARYRVGIVAFSREAQVVLPPTTDREAARAALADLRLGSGTSITAAIERALALVRSAGARPGGVESSSPPASILLLSDGAHTAGPPLPLVAAETARRDRVPVHTVALGTRQAVIRVPLAGGFEERVTVTPDPAALRGIARTTGGSYSAAPDAARLRAVYRELGSRLGRERRPREVTAAFAGAAALLILAGGALSTLWFRRAL